MIMIVNDRKEFLTFVLNHIYVITTVNAKKDFRNYSCKIDTKNNFVKQ